jgi:hypothetical protein
MRRVWIACLAKESPARAEDEPEFRAEVAAAIISKVTGAAHAVAVEQSLRGPISGWHSRAVTVDCRPFHDHGRNRRWSDRNGLYRDGLHRRRSLGEERRRFQAPAQ